MINILDQLQALVAAEGITITALERQVGASKGVISRAIKYGTDIQVKWLTKVVENYPQISTEWLLTGNGEMYKSKTSNEQSEWNVLLKEINDRDEIIRKQAEQIGALKAELSLKAKTASPAHDLQAAAAV